MNKAIEITPRWAVYRDTRQWVLVETYEGKDKDGNPKVHRQETFHSWLEQAMRYAADQECEGCESVAEVLESYMRLRFALKDASAALERGYADLHRELQETKAALRAREDRKRSKAA